MTPCKKKMDEKSLGELAALLNYYNIYDTTKKSGEDTRPSGPDLKKYLQERLRAEDKSIPKPPPKPQDTVTIDLQILSERQHANMLHEIARELCAYRHNASRAVRRTPKEYAREVILWLMEENLFNGGILNQRVFLMLFEGNYIPDPNKSVVCRGVDWVVYKVIPSAN